jgi:uncharacterized protein (DUF169 family)
MTTIDRELLATLGQMGLTSEPVAVGFLDAPPAGLDRIGRAEPAGCGYWRHAAEGHAFYTTPADHGNCAVGAFTHGVMLSDEQGAELQTLVGTMVGLKYIRPDEVAGLPHRSEPLQVAAYAPLDQATFRPDLVVFRGTARHIMLLSEAARAAGLFNGGLIMGRPACAMLPQALSQGAAIASVGCIGNRVYTGLGDGELYLAVPFTVLVPLLQHLRTTLVANAELEKFHTQRAASLSA